jgi:glycine hydroxymethyltransferase
MAQTRSDKSDGTPAAIHADLQKVKAFITGFTDYKKKRLALVSSENHSSKLLRASYCLGLSDQYCSRLPHNRMINDQLTFSHVSPLDDLNEMARDLTIELFDSADCDIRLLSGLSGLNVLLFSLLADQDVLFRMSDDHGGHLSTAPIAKRLNIDFHDMVLGEDFRLDLDHFAGLYRKAKPKVVFLDASYILFPYPVAQMRDIVGPDTLIIYDASHMIALIAGGMFQSPFDEGADIIHATTHKSLWGPQKSMLLFKRKDACSEKVQKNVELLVSNTQLHHIFALYLALLEFKHFGSQYARDIESNARYFAEKLDACGLMIAAREHGYTRSNQLWLELGSKAEAIEQFKKLDRLHISTNLIAIPRGRWGLRLAMNGITRLGVDKRGLDELARIFGDLFSGRKPLAALEAEVQMLKTALGEPKYSFDDSPLGQELIKQLVALE